MKQPKTVFECAIEIVSPVHLGCGEVYEPTSFAVDEEKNELIVFDPIFFVKNLEEEDRQRFSETCKKGTVASIIEVYKFLRSQKPAGRRIKLCNDFVDHYQSVLKLGTDERKILQNLNRFEISRTAFRPSDDRAYIPGSAVKGALRTAFVNYAAGKKNIPKENKRKGQDLEKMLLEFNPNKTETDPFRLVKVSDFQPAGYVNTKIVYAVNKKKKPSDKQPRGIAHILEVIEPGALFTGSITVEQASDAADIHWPVVFEELMAGALTFFKEENLREIKELKGAGINGTAADAGQNRLPLRIGRHSGAESLTVDGHRNIKIITADRKKPRFDKKASTIWLASETKNNQYNKGLLPFGWVCIQELSGDLHKKTLSYERDFQADLEIRKKNKQEAIQKAREEKERQQQEAEKKERELAEKARQEAEEKAALEAMTPEEREIRELQQPDVLEEKINIAFKKLDEFAPENQKKAAQLIKAYWQANNKWTKKGFSNKQWKAAREKIDKIKSILGEQ